MAIESKVFIGSSNLDRAEYDTETRTLRVWFQKGSVYTYVQVPETVWEGLESAFSPGSYLREFIAGIYG